MKSLMYYLFYTLFVIFLIIGCDDKTSDEYLLKFEFKLMDQNGLEANKFQFGDDIIFTFSIINEGIDVIYFDQFKFNSEEFFRVYNIVQTIERKDTIDMGKPYIHIFCNKIAGIQVPAKGMLMFQIPWIPESPWEVGVPYYSTHFCTINNNSPLPIGNYVTGFSSRFVFFSADGTYQTEEKHFCIEFEIY